VTRLAALMRLDPGKAREEIRLAIARNLGCYTWAAQELGVTYRTLLRYRQALNMDTAKSLRSPQIDAE